MDDRQLIKEIGRDNDLAFVILIKKYEKLVFNTSYKLVQNTSDAQDICQEVFLNAYLSIHQLINDNDLSGWLFRIAYNKSISFLRKKNPARANIKNTMEDGSLQSPFPSSFIESNTPSHTLEKKEEEEELFRAIDNLPEMQKKVFLMCKFEDLSHKEIGEMLNLSKSAVESLVHRAKANLRKALLTYFDNHYKQTI